MTKEILNWLEKELPLWVKEGILTQEGAQTLLVRYQDNKPETASSGKTLNMVFSLLGFALVGLGIISILAYNWDNLGHMERTILAFSCLLIAQLFSMFAKYYKRDDKALLEGSSIFWFLMVGASLAIIGQTYHLGGNVFDFIFIWLLLSFAIMFIMPSSGVAFFQIFLLTVVWILSRYNHFLDSFITINWNKETLQWVMLLFFSLWLGYYVWQVKNNKNANATVLLSWALVICLLISSLMEVFRYSYYGNNGNILIQLSLIFAIFYLIGKIYFTQGSRIWKNPFEGVGEMGTLILLLLNVSVHSREWLGYMWNPSPIHYTGFMWILLGLFVGLLVLFIRTKKAFPANGFIMLTPFVFWAYTTLMKYLWMSEKYADTLSYEAMIEFTNGATVYYPPILLINIFCIAGALWMIYRGSKEHKMGTINQGMIFIALIVWIHFANADFSLVVKGIVFIATGIIFLVVNSFMKSRMKGQQ